MFVVTLALYAEGSTDGDFLPQIILQTTEEILSDIGYSRSEMNIELPYCRWEKPADTVKREDCLLRVAQETPGYDILIIHSDGDDRGYEKTVAELFQPGKESVLKIAKDRPDEICEHLVPIIPVRMTEAWMLADPEALCRVLGKKADARTLGIPLKAKLVEKELNPKTTLNHIIKRAYPNASTSQWRERKNDLYKGLGSQISLKRLSDVPSYQQFVENMTATLRMLNFIQKQLL
jgi:Domain of unknown function (DUF4276)